MADSLPGEPESDLSFPSSTRTQLQNRPLQVESTLRMVETAFLASAASLIWFINFYFPFGPVLRVFFPIPIALVYLRWGQRAAWMAAVTSGLLLSVLMGPVRSVLFVIPFALMGVLLGATWHRHTSWIVSIVLGTMLGTVGVFFRLWFLSVLSGEDLWVYVINQVTAVIEWFFLKFELLMTPNLLAIQLGAIALVVLNNFIYLFLVHLAAWLLFDRLGNAIPRPPHWVQVLMDYE